jgi:Radical SAM superfamily
VIPVDVTLVSMPFAEVQRPSIALGLLQACLGGTGIRSEVVYGNLRFAETIGVVAYQAIQATPTDHLLGEWCFADRLLADVEAQDDEYLDLVLDVRCRGFPADREQRKKLMRWMRLQSAPFMDRLAQDIVARGPRIVGCSSMFQQHCASMSYFRTMLPKLAAAGSPYSLFYETKANLKRKQVRLLADAGVRWIQPGIESLDDNVLRLIGKGNSTLINLQLLKWCSEFGINAAWNMLSGVPGESDSWYAAMAEWLPAIFHLQPPSGVNRVRYDRFSHYHTRARAFGLTLQPSRADAYVYPLPRESLMQLAYSFEDEGKQGHVHRGLPGQPGQRKLQAVVEEWNDRWQTSRPVLRVHDDGDRLNVVETRPCARQRTWTLGGPGSRGLPPLRLRANARLDPKTAVRAARDGDFGVGG